MKLNPMKNSSGPTKAASQRHRVWPLKERVRMAALYRRTPRNSASEAAGEATPGEAFLKYILPLLGLAMMYVQGYFDENPIPMWFAIAAVCLHCCAIEVMKLMPTLDSEILKILSRASLAFGIILVVSLLSIFLPYEFSLMLVIVWTLMPVALAWPTFIYLALCLLVRGITSVVAKVVHWTRGASGTLKEEAYSPV